MCKKRVGAELRGHRSCCRVTRGSRKSQLPPRACCGCLVSDSLRHFPSTKWMRPWPLRESCVEMASKAVYAHHDPMLKKRDDFEDILEERRSSSDLRYALRCYAPVLYKDVTPCSADLLKGAVLQSEHVGFVVQQVSKETGGSVDAVRAEAAAILEEMAHRLQLSTIRFFAFALSKVFKTLFRSICVNEEGIQRLQQAVQEQPVVLLPSHRSYMDFLLMSYILYTYDLPLPVIAAGMDFMGMKIVGEMLRMSGAFFIRRSFGGDKLYWAVFSEYVRTMLKKGLAPIEFFLEGTRSRTAKSLTPKLGLLNIVMDPFLKGEVFDISLVPVSISYERTLEEALYARELLGVPKPKESTSGLFKARKILGEDYGSIHVYFGPPVSVRSVAEGRVDRSRFNLLPRHIPRKPSEEVQGFVTDVAYRLVRAQEDNMVLQPWVLLAALLLQNQPQGLSLDRLTAEAVWLRDLSRQYGAFLHWPDHTPPAAVVRSSLSLHRGLLRIREQRVTLAHDPNSGAEDALLSRAVVVLSCASYRNQLLHVFLRPALLAAALCASASSRRQDVFSSFSFLRNLFSNEFVLCPGAAVQDFEEACYLLMKTGALCESQQDVLAAEGGARTLSFLCSLLEPFVQGYQVVCRFLCEEASEPLTEKGFVPAVRKFVIRRLLSGELRHVEVLSSDLQKNCLAALLRLGAVTLLKGAGGSGLKVNTVMVNSLEDALGGNLPTQKAARAHL
ncbi:dihydroxyacetone phosphate acyltransferase isoform X2 [Synchiropus splendidus]|uniref:dihydroxyacetone phosphate acyltransferase isoform X2 n=1 Tax=Synchiropus splendidus TaxID=270530 RepID=UPI00237DA4D3|nr:dihydroxyacetone phosphate acyltransferase isoform X2 [Synchiropus splendidus]